MYTVLRARNLVEGDVIDHNGILVLVYGIDRDADEDGDVLLITDRGDIRARLDECVSLWISVVNRRNVHA